MCNEWMPRLELRLSPDEFRQLPRNATFSYAYHEDVVWVNPRPRYYHAQLDLLGLDLEGQAEIPVRNLRDDDWEALIPLFAEAFAGQQPFAGVTASVRNLAAVRSLDQTRTGGDGPFIAPASFVAEHPSGELLGAILITLVPPGDPTDWDCYFWVEPPPLDCIEKREGWPHLTWIFVRPGTAGRGVGTRLLRASAEALLALGFTDLISTFLIGNESSMLWHWRTGFRLLAYPGSARRFAP